MLLPQVRGVYLSIGVDQLMHGEHHDLEHTAQEHLLILQRMEKLLYILLPRLFARCIGRYRYRQEQRCQKHTDHRCEREPHCHNQVVVVDQDLTWYASTNQPTNQSTNQRTNESCRGKQYQSGIPKILEVTEATSCAARVTLIYRYKQQLRSHRSSEPSLQRLVVVCHAYHCLVVLYR
jgi:hypothetical protein